MGWRSGCLHERGEHVMRGRGGWTRGECVRGSGAEWVGRRQTERGAETSSPCSGAGTVGVPAPAAAGAVAGREEGGVLLVQAGE